MSKRDSFLLRLSPEVMDALRRWSEDEFRSTNAQIEMLLARALEKAGRLPPEPCPPTKATESQAKGKRPKA